MKKNNNNNYYCNNKKDMISFALWLLKRMDIKLYQSKLYFKSNGKYISDDRLLLKNINKFLPLTKHQDKEILHQLCKFSMEFSESNVEFPIIINNGVLVNGIYYKDYKYDFTPFHLNVNYNENAYDNYVDTFMNDISCNRLEIRQTLEEILGHIILTNNFPAHVFFLLGAGANGKSTFEEMINNFTSDMGQNLNLEAFNDDTSVASLRGKLCNCSDETENIYIEKCRNYKTLASGNTITLRPIYSQPLKLKNTATLILSANVMPNFKDKTNGFFRRLVIVPFDFKVTKTINNLHSLLSTPNAKSYILNLAIAGATRIRNNNNKLSYNKYVEEEIKKYILDIDSVANFLADNDNIHGNTTQSVYDSYKKYCINNGYQFENKRSFSHRLISFGFKTQPRDGKRHYFKK